MRPQIHSEPPYYYCQKCGTTIDMTSSEALEIDSDNNLVMTQRGVLHGGLVDVSDDFAYILRDIAGLLPEHPNEATDRLLALAKRIELSDNDTTNSIKE